MKKYYWIGVMVLGLIALVPQLERGIAAVWENMGNLSLNHALIAAPLNADPAHLEVASGYFAHAGTEMAGYQMGLLAVWHGMPLPEPVPVEAAALVTRMLTKQTGELAQTGQVEALATWYARSQTLGFALPDYWLQVGREYAAQREWVSAVAAFEQAIAINPDRQEAWYELGVVYIASARHEEAIPVLEQTLLVRPQTVPLSLIYYQLGFAYQRQQNTPDIAAARHAFQTALDLNEYGETDFRTETFFELGYSYTLEQTWATAILYFEQAITADPGHYAAHVHLGRAYWRSGDVANGLHYGQAAITLNPDIAAAYLLVSDIYREQGDTLQAQASFTQAYTLDPNNPQVQARLQYFPDGQNP